VRKNTTFGPSLGLTGLAYIPTAANVLLGVDVDQTVGTVTQAAASDVRTGTTYGPSLGLTGTCNVPTAAQTLLAVPVDATTGTVTQATASDVRTGTTYGPSLGLTGTCAVPTAAQTLIGVNVDATVGAVTQAAVADVRKSTTYGPSLGLTGLAYIPTASKVLVGTLVDQTTGAVTQATASDVREGTTYGPSLGLTGTLHVENTVYSLIVPASVHFPVIGHTDAVMISAGSAADALAMAKSMFSGDIDARWVAATSAETEAAADMEDWTMNVTVTSPAGVVLYDETITAVATDTLAVMAADMVTALETAGGASLTPSYDAGTGLLTVATIGDGIGDSVLTCNVYPPLENPVAVPGFVSTIVDEGVAGAVLTALLLPANPIPAIILKAKKQE
jgi:uncharacterized membrane protein YdcZ (DUF606 family)